MYASTVQRATAVLCCGAHKGDLASWAAPPRQSPTLKSRYDTRCKEICELRGSRRGERRMRGGKLTQRRQEAKAQRGRRGKTWHAKPRRARRGELENGGTGARRHGGGHSKPPCLRVPVPLCSSLAVSTHFSARSALPRDGSLQIGHVGARRSTGAAFTLSKQGFLRRFVL